MRRAFAAVAVGFGIFLTATPAGAAGAGGVEVSPLRAGSDGHPATAFHVRVAGTSRQTERFLVRNLTQSPRVVRLYAADVRRDEAGTFTVAGPGSSELVALPTQTLSLKPQQRLELSMDITPKAGLHGTDYAAVVVEVPGAAVVTRAATLVYVEGEIGTSAGVSWWQIAAAAAAAAIVAAVLFVRHRRRHFLGWRRHRSAG